MAPRRIAICLDGTWNVRDDTTNIWRIFALIPNVGPDGVEQLSYYDQGVGTSWYDRLTGGALGTGMYRNVRQAYNWLCERYRPDDEIYLFGFSRGAATALSLANLVDRCGIVGANSRHSFEDSYRLYAKPGFGRQTWASRQIRARGADTGCRPIVYLGLFDTVASLYLKRWNDEAIHILTLPESARRVAHAIALDENRAMFQSVEFAAAPVDGILEEHWFAGAHANIGGGYRYDALAVPPLSMIMRAAGKEGLAFRDIPEASTEEVMRAMERDSHAEFAGGWLPLIPATRRPRKLNRNARGNATEVVDESVIERCRRYRNYYAQCQSIHPYFPLDRLPPQGDFNVRRTFHGREGQAQTQ